jgi:hypothetical protein
MAKNESDRARGEQMQRLIFGLRTLGWDPTLLFAGVGIAAQDVEIVIYEAPAENWGFRGLHGDEAALSYKVRV